MKQILLFCLALSFTTNSLAQYADTTKHILATDYLKKSKNQKTAAWILLGSGGVMTMIGTVVGVHEGAEILVNLFDPNPTPARNDATLATVLMSGGVLAMAGSVPLFIASGKNKRKAAASVSFKMENATNIYQSAFTNTRYPVLAIQIRL